jgi:hypothetical protein
LDLATCERFSTLGVGTSALMAHTRTATVTFAAQPGRQIVQAIVNI